MSRQLTPNFMFLTKFGPTDVMTGLSRAKNCEESAGDVRFSVAPQKPRKNAGKLANIPIFFFRRQKIEICKSSKTRVAEVSWRSERSSRGKRTFEVRFDRFDNSFG